jgi:hypothetical protein
MSVAEDIQPMLVFYWESRLGIYCCGPYDSFEWGPYEDVEHARLAFQWRYGLPISLQETEEPPSLRSAHAKR